MPRTVEGVVSYLESAVKTIAPKAVPSPYKYSPDKNSENEKFVFAVRPGGLSASTQLNRSMNVVQSFDIELIKSFVEVSKGDKEVEQIIFDLHDLHEQIFQRISLRNSTEFRILNIEDFSSGGPEIDRVKKTVSLTFTYRIHYLKQIKEGA